jgi:thioredoxin 1
MLAPELDKFAAEHGDIIVGKIDVDECRDLAISLGINTVPTLFFFRNGKMEQKLVGYMSADSLAKKLNL